MNNPEMNGHVDFTGQVTVDLEAQQYHANNLDLTVKATGAGLPFSPVEAQLLANVKADLKQQRVNLSNLKLHTLGTSISGQVNITDLDTSPAASGQIAVANFSPKNVTKKLGITLPNTSDVTVLNKVKLDMNFSGNMDGANLDKLTIVLDDTRLTGTASVKNFAAPAIRFDIHVDDIDLDRYLPPAAETSPTTATPGTAASAATQLPLEPLRALNLEGNFRLDKLKITGARSSDISLGVHAKSGLITLNPIKANLYNGNYKGNIALDVRKDTPKFSFNEALSGVNVGPLLKDTMGKELVAGTANASAQLTATGADLVAIKKTLNGKAKFNFLNGAVKGVNIGQMIREANAKLNKKPKPPKTNNETDFAEMSGSVTITNGIVRNKDLVMKSPLLRIHGKGSVDLPRQKIKYLVNTSIVKSNEGQAGKELSELKSLTIPIKVTGTFDKPKFSLDLGRVLQARAKKAVEKKKKQIKKDVDKRIKSEKKKLRKRLKDELKKKLGIKF
jgi:AsmA protein